MIKFYKIGLHKYSLKNEKISSRVSKRESVFTMISNLLDDFHKCSSDFFVVFIPSLSIMTVGERN